MTRSIGSRMTFANVISPVALFVARGELIHRVAVYALHMSRTNVEIEDELIARVMRRYGLRTKRAAVELALRRLDLEPMTREEALAMRGTGWEGDLDELRTGYRGSSAA